MARYKWEPERGVSGRYRDLQTGRFVSSSTVRRELDRYLTNSDEAARALSRALRNRELSLADWELGMRRVIKNTHLNSIALERGGWANMRPSDYGRAGQIIRGQYGYLHNFAGQIADGTQKLDGTLEWRAKLYGQAGRNTWYQSHAANATEKVTHQRSIRGKRDSCWQCIDLDGRIFKIDDKTFPLPGRRVCNHNCGCHLEYLSLVDGEYKSLETA